MKKVLKIIGIILLALVIIIGTLLFALTHWLKSALGDSLEDYAKAFTMQSQIAANLPPLENIGQRTVDIPYITKNGTVEVRPIRLYLPEQEQQPMPVVYVPHYEMAEDSAELRRYLARGWAVASPTKVASAYNGLLTDDDLVFNNAALYALRHMEEFDRQRIAIVGGSAGGYMALMLSALQMGNCATVANAPITNVYFNFYQYFQRTKEVKNPPFFLALVAGSFSPILENFPDPGDIARWEAFSAVGLADCFNSPLAVTHFTSDVLVPIDQTTREFTYAHEGDTMPEGFSTRLPADNPGVLGRSLADELPQELTHVEHIPITDPNADSSLPFHREKPFNLDIFDDGPTQSAGGHRATSGTGIIDDTPYLEEMFSRSLARTEFLTSGKLLLLLERYQGNSIQLPAHQGVDDAVYGSLEIYRQEVVEELKLWVENHSLAELDTAMREAIAGVDEDEEYLAAWEEIKMLLE